MTPTLSTRTWTPLLLALLIALPGIAVADDEPTDIAPDTHEVTTVEDVNALPAIVTSIVILDGDRTDTLEAIATSHPELTRLTIKGLDRSSTGIPAIRAFKQLTHLSISGSISGLDNRRTISETIGAMPSIRHLHLNLW